MFRYISVSVTPTVSATGTTGALHAAVRAGNLQKVIEMLERGVDVEAADDFDERPVHIAAMGGHLDVLKALVARRCNVNARELSQGMTPLHNAALHGDPNLVLTLISAGANVNARSSTGISPLHFAAMRGHLSSVKALVSANADVNAEDNEKITPLFGAVRQGFEDTAIFLIQNGAVVNARNFERSTPLLCATGQGHLNITKLLIQNKADVNATDNRMWTPLHNAAFRGNLESTKILIASGAEVDARTYKRVTPLHHAAYFWHVEVVKYLLAKGAEVNGTGQANWTPLHFAADDSSTRLPLNESGHYASQPQDSKLNTIKVLIENGADINAKVSRPNDETALHFAVKFGDPIVARYLLENGAYYDAKPQTYFNTGSNNSVNALLRATKMLFQAVKEANCCEIEKCVQEGAPVNSRSIKYKTPLMYASWKGHSAVVNVLLKKGASINLSDSSGITPLHYAAKFGHHEILCALLQHGAVYNARTKSGRKTPLHFAEEGGKKQVTATLNLIECMFIRVAKNDGTVLKELNELKEIKCAEFLAIKNCTNANKETLGQIASKNGCEELCKLFSDL